MFIWMKVCIYIYMYVCMYVCRYIEIYVWMDGWMYKIEEEAKKRKRTHVSGSEGYLYEP